MIIDQATKTARRALDVFIFREAEMRNRAWGRYEQANAWRMMCDAIESGDHMSGDCCAFDRGVFDLYGPKDFDEMPFLVELSPRLHPELYQRSGAR